MRLFKRKATLEQTDCLAKALIRLADAMEQMAIRIEYLEARFQAEDEAWGEEQVRQDSPTLN